MALGLGAGVCFYYLTLDGQSPSRFTNGRVGKLEEQFLELTGSPLHFLTFDGPERSWAAAREAVDAGARPCCSPTSTTSTTTASRLISPATAVPRRYDGEVAHLSDTGFEELQQTRLDNLARARHGQHPVFPLDGHMLTIPDPAPLADPRAAAPRAIARNARQMIEPAMDEIEGLPALRRSPPRSGAGPMSWRTGSGRRAFATR